MKELLHKAWLFGVGMFDFTKEKVEAAVQEMVKRGEISEQEGPEAVKQMLAKAQDAQQSLVQKVKELTKNAIDEINEAQHAGYLSNNRVGMRIPISHDLTAFNFRSISNLQSRAIRQLIAFLLTTHIIDNGQFT